MTKQTAAPLKDESLSVAPNEAYGLVGEFHEGLLLLDAPYQRGSVWTTDQREELIRSWLTGTPIPAVIINDRRAAGWTTPDGSASFELAVIDGRQRVETAIAWFGGTLPVPASWFSSEDVAETVETADGPYVTFDGLTLIAQRAVKRLMKFPVARASLPDLASEARTYLRVNGAGTQQTPDDLANAAQYA